MTTKAIKATGTTLIGTPVSRVDGRLKVTGRRSTQPRWRQRA